MGRIVKRYILLIFVFIFTLTQAISVFAVNSDDYKDIKNNWAKEYIEDLINLGKIDGYSDNTIRPENLITRAEFSKILVEAMEIDVNTKGYEMYFRDVRLTDWYYEYVTILKELSIIDGYDDGTFKPNKNISRAEMLAMVVRISKDNLKISNNTKLYKDVRYNHWGYRDISFASKADIIVDTGDYLEPDEFVTRQEVFYTMDKMLWNQKSDEINTDELISFVQEYNKILDLKYNNVDSDVDELLKMSFGGQVDSINDVSKKNEIYNRLGIDIVRTNNIYSPKVDEVSKDLVKLSFEYELYEKEVLKTGIRENSESGVVTYYLKNIDGDWLIYSMVFEDNSNKNTSGKLNLVWDYVSYSVDKFSGGKIEGLNIISPTWFTVSDVDGSIESRANQEYVNWAHDNDYKVWALITNDFDKERTSLVLKNPASRSNLINQLIEYVDEYNIDGINVDFENMKTEDRDRFTQFIKELSLPLKERGITLSVDVTVIVPNSNWSNCYDREALAQIVDYIAVMTYDQHWSTSPVSGSVAQLTWVETEVIEMLEQVPNEKLLLGLPFYTRVWKEQNGDVTSSAISMEDAENLIIQNNAKKVWDAESGQYYAEYYIGDITYKIWLEDATSIDMKSQLVNKYDLAGVASWREGFETKDVWNVIQENLKFE